MSTNKIKINTVNGGKDKHMLKGCYFLPSAIPGNYDFYDKNNKLLNDNVGNGEPFDFKLDGLSWEIYNLSIDDLRASGAWQNNDGRPNAAFEESGTFTAQAGGGEDEKVEDRIRIDRTHTDGGGGVGELLKGCFFTRLDDSRKFEFFNPNGDRLNDNVRNNVPFEFRHLEIDWELTSDFSQDDRHAHGPWKILNANTGEEEGGTFTAQAGGGLETVSSACA